MRERPALQHVSRRQNGSAGSSDGVPAVAAPQETARPSRQRPRTHDLHSSLNGNPRCGRIVRPHAAAQRGHMRLPAGWRSCSPCRPAFPPRRGVSLLHAPWPPAARLPPTLCPVDQRAKSNPFKHGPRWVLYGRNRIWIFSPYKNLYQIDQRVQSIFPKTPQQASRRAPWWTTDCKPTSLSHAARLACAALVVRPA